MNDSTTETNWGQDDEGRIRFLAAFESMDAWTDLPPVQWIIDGILPLHSNTLLVGKPKAGKTYLVLAMLRAMLEGGEFLGQSIARSTCPIWYFSEADKRAMGGQQKEIHWGRYGNMVQGVSLYDSPAFANTKVFADYLFGAYEEAPVKPCLIVHRHHGPLVSGL